MGTFICIALLIIAAIYFDTRNGNNGPQGSGAV